MPTPAFPHDHLPDQEQRRIKIDGKPHPYVDQLVWPGIATLPGLPLGAQIVGPWLEDHTPIRFASLIEREFGGFTPPPMFKD
ncbi:MAG: amidase, partial [Rhizobiales bacterium]|nr:amidase [Hyphomicrobiales bacterium]